jgi:hypothetical protein
VILDHPAAIIGETMTTIKEMVKDGKTVKFSHYRHNQLWYKTDCGFQFAVPVSDIGDASFHAEERAITLMRYIRKQMDVNKEGLADSSLDSFAETTQP